MSGDRSSRSTFVFVIILSIICIVIITERSFLKGVKEGGRRAYSNAKADAKRRRETAVIRREERAIQQEEKLEQRRKNLEAKEARRQERARQEEIKKSQELHEGGKNRKVVSGVSFATTLNEEDFVKKTPEMKEITPSPESEVPDFVINREMPTEVNIPETNEILNEELPNTEIARDATNDDTENGDATDRGTAKRSTGASKTIYKRK